MEDTAVTTGKDSVPVITNVYEFGNGMCMVYDQYGKQMPDFQGLTYECLPKIRAAGFTGDVSCRLWAGFSGSVSYGSW
jgi:hypothetical protein